jgi:hypothetical protein
VTTPSTSRVPVHPPMHSVQLPLRSRKRSSTVSEETPTLSLIAARKRALLVASHGLNAYQHQLALRREAEVRATGLPPSLVSELAVGNEATSVSMTRSEPQS